MILKPLYSRAAGSAIVFMAFVAGNGVHAHELYAGAGLFGVQLGYAHALTSSVNFRADYMTLGRYSKNTKESGTEYIAQVDWSRKSLLADWFPFESSTFRLTGGATFNNVMLDLTAGGANTKVDINGKTYTLGAGDQLNVKIKMPGTTPYLGLGWGHKPTGTPGWGFHADLGVSAGRFKVTENRTGALANGGVLGVSQTDVDKEIADIRDSVAKINVLPQLTLGFFYRF